MVELKRKFWKWRRAILKTFIPEWVWPDYITLDGVKIPVKDQPYSFGTKRLLTKGKYELSERQLLAGIISPGDTIIEMGGSIGVLTAILSHLTGEAGKVLSIEASSTSASISRKWLREKKNVQVITGFAFPVFNCRHNIHITSFDEVYGSLGSTVDFKYDKLLHDPHEDIYDIGLICQKYKLHPDILVVDVEGSENIIIYERPAFPASLKYVLIELHPLKYGMERQKEILAKIEAEHFLLLREEKDVYLFQRHP